jgi:hypothetical protein
MDYSNESARFYVITLRIDSAMELYAAYVLYREVNTDFIELQEAIW